MTKDELIQYIKAIRNENVSNITPDGSLHWLPTSQKEIEKCADQVIRDLNEIHNNPKKIIEILLQSCAQQRKLEFYQQNSFRDILYVKGFRIEIHDYETKEDRERPRAVIRHVDETGSDDDEYADFTFNKDIDILAMIEQDPLNIRHPAVLLAIRRWKNIIRAYGRIQAKRNQTIKVKPKGRDFYHRKISERTAIYKIANNHLKNIGKAILDGAHNDILSPGLFYILDKRNRSRTNEKYVVLAWNLLGTDSKLKTTDRFETKLRLLKQKLDKLVTEEYAEEHRKRDELNAMLNNAYLPLPPISKLVEYTTEPVIRFLEDDYKKNERRGFLYIRQKRANILAAFDAWTEGVEIGTIQEYRRKARRELKARKDAKELVEWFSDIANYNPRWNGSASIQEILDLDNLLNWFIPDIRRK